MCPECGRREVLRLAVCLIGLVSPLLSGQEEITYVPGPDVKAPKLVHYVEPEFSHDSKEAYVEGVVKLSIVVTTEGKAKNCKVTRGLTEGQNDAAIKAVERWEFEPGTKDGKPVPVRVSVEVGFHLL